VVVCDNTFVSEVAEEADRLRDPTHVRNYGTSEWHVFFEQAGLTIVAEQELERWTEVGGWLDRAGTPLEDRARVKELLDHEIVDGKKRLPTLVVKGVKQ
jgi:hypothetical protein